MKTIRYTDYHGTRKWRVSHPKYKGTLEVAAPDRSAAIVAAAEHYGTAWTSYDFYAFCAVTEL